jgi:tRNA-modifying protein YgfZ
MDSELTLNGVARLGYFACIRVSGEQAQAFLQSQLTSSFVALPADRARLAGFCSAKGRLQASFVGWKQGDNDIILACAPDLLEATLKRLAMFVLRMKCRLTDASAQLPVFGLAGTPARPALQSLAVWERREWDGGTAIRLPDAAGRRPLGLWIPDAQGAAAATELPLVAPIEWRRLQVSSGLPIVEAKTVDLFVPQMINFELLGGVDFAKGCYPGQEVVARSQYRGTLKRRMFLFDCAAQASAGQEVFSSADPGQPAGVVVNAAPDPALPGSSALIELKLSELLRGTLHLGSAQGPQLRRRDLPYDVPSPSSELA